MKMNWKWIAVGLVVLVALALQPAGHLPHTVAQTPGGTLQAAWQSEWEGLDPHTISSLAGFQVLNNVLETLTTFDDNTSLVPGLATSWESNADNTVWTFNLREGVQFHNGEVLSAEHVVASMNRLIDPETGSGNASNAGGEDAVWEAVDGLTVQVTLPESNAIFDRTLGFNKTTGILALETLESENITAPIGTGPFRIADVQGNTFARLEKHDDYWQDGLPYLDAVEIQVISDDAAREAALLGGEVDWIFTIAPQNFEALQDDPNVVVETAPQLAYDYMGVNLTREPFDDVRVRQAMAMAIDRDQICQASFFGLCTPIQAPIGPGLPDFEFGYAPYNQDIEQARSLIEDAGLNPDEAFDMQLLPTVDFGETVRAAQVIQQQLRQIGIGSSIFAPEFSEWLELEGNFMYDIYICSWNGLKDPDQYYFLQHVTDKVFNFTGYSNAEFDRLVTEARQTSDFEERFALYEQADRILVDDAPYIYMYTKEEARAWSPSVNGYVVRPDQATNFWSVWLEG